MDTPWIAYVIVVVAVLMAGMTLWGIVSGRKARKLGRRLWAQVLASGPRPITGSTRKDAAIILTLWIAVAGSSLALLTVG